MIGYAEIAARLIAEPTASDSGNRYRVWIEEYAGAPYRDLADKAARELDGLAERYDTPARSAELQQVFREATRLETDFWEMGWRVTA